MVDLRKDSITLHREANDAGVVRDWTGGEPKPRPVMVEERLLIKRGANVSALRRFVNWLTTPLW